MEEERVGTRQVDCCSLISAEAAVWSKETSNYPAHESFSSLGYCLVCFLGIAAIITMAKRREVMIDYQSGLLRNVGTQSGPLVSVIAWNVTWLVVSHCWKPLWPSSNYTRRHPATSPNYKTAFVAWSSGRCSRQRVWRLIMLFGSRQRWLKVHRNGLQFPCGRHSLSHPMLRWLSGAGAGSGDGRGMVAFSASQFQFCFLSVFISSFSFTMFYYWVWVGGAKSSGPCTVFVI